MSYEHQQNIYADFKERYGILISQAKAENTYRITSNEILGSRISIFNEEVVHRNEYNVPTSMITLDVDLGITYDMATQKLKEAKERYNDKHVQSCLGEYDGFYKWVTHNGTLRTEYFLVIERPDYTQNGNNVNHSKRVLMVWTP
jgi:hypothetical protein